MDRELLLHMRRRIYVPGLFSGFQRRPLSVCVHVHACACVCMYIYLYAPVCTRDRRGKLTDRTTSLIRMMGVLRPELDGRTQRLYSSSKNCEQEWMSTPARCFL